MAKRSADGTQRDLFGAPAAPPPALPPGFRYESDFLEQTEEEALIARIASLPLEEARYKAWNARRRIMSYGARYDFSNYTLLDAAPVADFLHPLRERIGAWCGIPASAFNHAIVTEYRPGTQLGWHRDVHHFENIVGVSLGGRARMRLRPYPPARGARAAVTLEIEPRSIYSMQGPARWDWQHAISPTTELRYSITFRTLRMTTNA